jgi:flagellar biosynthesis/type III secretory pathway protein FliH
MMPVKQIANSPPAGASGMTARTKEEWFWYELSLKPERDAAARLKRAREEGFQEGLKEGLECFALVGQVQMLQQLNGEAESSRESLKQLTAEELNRLIAAGIARFRERERNLPP